MNRFRMEAERKALRAKGYDTPELDAALAKVPATTKPAWTPGPWFADPDDEDAFDGQPIFAQHRAEGWVPIANVPVDYDDRTEREANARLIAAAPDLAKAALSLVWDLGKYEHLDDDSYINVDAGHLRALAAAFAKAVQP